MADETEMLPIKLSSKTLVHISSGLYRSPANALKELISNSFDADATFVRINTNSPNFNTLTCVDDGDGMTLDEFRRLMDGGIGDSRKRVGEGESPKWTKKKRPIIGRIGIGMLAVAQICYTFRIVSHHKESKTAFEAVVDLNTKRLKEISVQELSQAQKKDGFRIGEYKFNKLPFDPEQAGMRITSNDLIYDYTRRYVEDVNRKEFTQVPLDYKKFLQEVYKQKSIRKLGDYWRLLWELSVECPIRYLDDAPFSEELIKSALQNDSRKGTNKAPEIVGEICSQLQTYDFDVMVDGMSLRKPFIVPNNQKNQSAARLTAMSVDKPVRGMNLKYKGYIYTQTSAIYPAELRGILIRVRNVAIGDYDLNCLNYEIVQGFRFDWVSGEVYVEEGLEDALNVDRHSFNEVHPHYLSLQNDIHDLLSLGGVFREARSASEKTDDKKESQSAVDDEFISAASGVLNVNFRITRLEQSSPENNPVEIHKENNVVTIYKHPVWPRSKPARAVAEQVIVAYKLAQEYSEDMQSAEKIAYSILQKAFQI